MFSTIKETQRNKGSGIRATGGPDVSSDESAFSLLFLPREILFKIVSYTSYDETSSCRIVCKTFNAVCQQRLNAGFNRVNKLHAMIQKEVKSKLPRRESERRNHALARHVDILSAVETRLSLLSMTYSKYMDIGVCCFIPGRVLDEMFHVLFEIRHHPNPPRTHELLQELRDISSMAMEHFDEKVVPQLKDVMSPSSDLRVVLAGSSPSSPTSSLNSFTGTALCNLMSLGTQNAIRRRTSITKVSLSVLALRKDLVTCQKRILKQDKKVAEMEKKLTETNGKLVEEERRRAELDRRIIEYDQRFVDIMTEVGRVRSVSEERSGRKVESKKEVKVDGAKAVKGNTSMLSEKITKTINKSGHITKQRRSRKRTAVAERVSNSEGDLTVEDGKPIQQKMTELTRGKRSKQVDVTVTAEKSKAIRKKRKHEDGKEAVQADSLNGLKKGKKLEVNKIDGNIVRPKRGRKCTSTKN